MKKLLKKIFKTTSKKLVNIFCMTNIGRFFFEVIEENIKDIKKNINHNGIDLNFYCPNRTCYYRVETFSTKEPETLLWIDSFKKDEILWEIGANIGLYSCYAAKKNNSKVYSFEPSFLNLEIISKNIFINNLEEKVIIIPVPLSNINSVADFNMSSTTVGGAMSNYGKDSYDANANRLRTIFKYKTISINSDELAKNWKIKRPDHIKIDVDGIEHLIINGMDEILKTTKSVLIEVDKKFEEHKNIIEDKLRKKDFEKTTKFDTSLQSNTLNQFNQIWIKK